MGVEVFSGLGWGGAAQNQGNNLGQNADAIGRIEVEIGKVVSDLAGEAETIYRDEASKEELAGDAVNFFGGSFDPKIDQRKIHEVIEYAISEHGIKGPHDMLNFLTSLDVESRGRFQKLTLMDRIWALVKEKSALKALQGLKGLERG
jgi:hypothetical protein